MIRLELGSLDRVAGFVKTLGFVSGAPGFHRQPLVLNGFADLIVDVFGEERGLHARSAVGVAELPWNIPVEIETIVEVCVSVSTASMLGSSCEDHTQNLTGRYSVQCRTGL